MTYIKWKDEVESYLLELSDEEKKKVFSYFSEMYADKRDAGKSEERIIEEFGAPYDVALKILSEYRESARAGSPNASTGSAGAGTGSAGPATEGIAPAPQPDYSKSQYPQSADAPTRSKPAKIKRRAGGKGWLIALCLMTSLLFIFLVLFLVEVASNGWKLKVTYEMKEFAATEITTKLDLSLAAGKMDLVYCDGDSVEVSYPTSDSFGYVVKESNGTVSVKPKSGIHFLMFRYGNIPAITVRIPHSMTLQLDFEISAGDATIENMSFTSIRLEISAGSLAAGKLTCDDFDMSISAGAVSFTGVTCAKADIDVSAGTATIHYMDCDKLTSDVSAGTVNLTLAGNKTDYTISISKSAGKINGVSEQIGTVADKSLKFNVSAGTINVGFDD